MTALAREYSSARQLYGSLRTRLGRAIQDTRSDRLINGKARGKPSRFNEDQRTGLAQAIERGPTLYMDGVVRSHLCDLAQWMWEEFRVSVSEETSGQKYENGLPQALSSLEALSAGC